MHSHFNGVKTFGLFGLMWVILLGVGYVVAHTTNNPVWLMGFAIFGLVSTVYTYWNSASLALRSMSAYPVSEREQPRMYAIVRELSERAGQPMPSLHVAPTRTPNAFATGRNPEHAAVCCTEGILDLLDDRELRGVLGHELMHVYNRDILTSSVAQAMGGLITTVAQMLYFFGGGRRDEPGLGGIALVLLAPLASSLIRLAISRTREYDADEDGSRLTGDPLALASALRKLEAGTQAAPLTHTPRTEQVAHVMIANPFSMRGPQRLLSTHPPMEQRIRRLEQMAGY
ncbi:zinc metalloprotease HtpX [Nanchangia anserum]|uniref:Protease HtpX homolog n=1 Tax=Nanchangia anserum TaxID=2692125 RepID=A0A8I0KVU8_9ACTO|nr:zinc metalloprotease HtpX [Nanchangia anserum]MBD3689319.1 zinc metalloprotease HtpX [Nanchangia anserum]QOX81533.1 zinc metalloprotease HtpX [Nanchangia anserum]